MNSRRKEIALVTAGILAGIAVSGSATQAAAGLMASPSSQRFYVNEQRIPLEARARRPRLRYGTASYPSGIGGRENRAANRSQPPCSQS